MVETTGTSSKSQMKSMPEQPPNFMAGGALLHIVLPGDLWLAGKGSKSFTESLSLELFTSCLDKVLGNQFQVGLLGWTR